MIQPTIVDDKYICTGINNSSRNSVQDRWTSGEVPVIAATCSFGMGVDKGSVRFALMWNTYTYHWVFILKTRLDAHYINLIHT